MLRAPLSNLSRKLRRPTFLDPRRFQRFQRPSNLVDPSQRFWLAQGLESLLVSLAGSQFPGLYEDGTPPSGVSNRTLGEAPKGADGSPDAPTCCAVYERRWATKVTPPALVSQNSELHSWLGIRGTKRTSSRREFRGCPLTMRMNWSCWESVDPIGMIMRPPSRS